MADPEQAKRHLSSENILPYSLALVLIVGFLIFVGRAIWYCPEDLDLLKTLAAVFLGPIGTILGFYFGQKPTERLTEINKEITEEVEQRRDETEEKKEELAQQKRNSVTVVSDEHDALLSALSYIEQLEKRIQRLDALLGPKSAPTRSSSR